MVCLASMVTLADAEAREGNQVGREDEVAGEGEERERERAEDGEEIEVTRCNIRLCMCRTRRYLIFYTTCRSAKHIVPISSSRSDPCKSNPNAL